MYELNASLPSKGQRQDLYLHGGPPGQLLSAMPYASLVSKLAFYGGGFDWMSIVQPNPLGQSVQLRRGSAGTKCQKRVMKCSVPLAILLEITANLYVHRREIRHSKRGQARRQRRQRRQATERPNRLRRQHGQKKGSVGCVWPQRASSAGRKDVDGQGAPSR
jgi:hypothetical protein